MRMLAPKSAHRDLVNCLKGTSKKFCVLRAKVTRAMPKKTEETGKAIMYASLIPNMLVEHGRYWVGSGRGKVREEAEGCWLFLVSGRDDIDRSLRDVTC
jgi:hypothetical protein